MKIGEKDSAHELAKMMQASSKFDFFFDDLHLQIIESISPKASVENSSAQWAIFLMIRIVGTINDDQALSKAAVNLAIWKLIVASCGPS